MEGETTLPYKTAFIINPRAGRGRSLRVWRRLEPLLQEGGLSYSVHQTRFPGDGSTIAEQARSNGAELLVVLGGDGTLLEVVNGLDFKKNIVGIIPGGTGNGFRRSLKIPGDSYQALLGLAVWNPRQIDLGTINGMYFLNVVGFGFDAAVAKLATVDNKVLRGYPAYVTAFLAKLATFGSFPATVTCDKETIEEQKTILAVVSNGRYYGGQLCIAPQAKVDDGKLDICLVRKTNYANTTTLAVKAFFKKHLGHNAILTATAKEITINAPESIPVHIDGEILGELPAKISIRPGLLTVLAPP
jgi:YegS/Rv2252/BmrU family lipid kinase